MRKKLLFLLGIVFLIRNQVRAGDDYLKTLEKVISSIERGKGALKIDLNSGVYRKNLNGVNTFLDVSPETSSLAEIEILNGHVSSVKYTFSKPVLLINGSDVDCYGLYVRSFNFTGTSLAIDSFSTPKSRHCTSLNKSTYTKLKAEFGMPTNFFDVLNGGIFQKSSSSTWDLCRSNFANCNNPSNLVRSVTIQKTATSPDGFTIKLFPDAKIPLGDSRVYENYIVAGNNDNLVISQLNVLPETKSLTVTLSGNLNTLKNGMFQSKGCKLSIQEPVIENITLTINTTSGSGITIFNADVKGKLDNTSFIDIGSETASSKILIAEGSEFKISDFNLACLPNNAVHLKLGGGSKMKLNIASANLVVNKLTTLRLKNSNFRDASFTAEFFSERAKTYFLGSLYDVSLDIDGGVFALNDFSNLGIKSGKMHSTRLEINTTIEPVLLGRMDVFKIDFTDNNEYKASDKSFILKIGPNSFIGQKADDPVHFEKDEPFPLGGITYDLNIPEFLANTNKDFVLKDGKFKGVISYWGNEQYRGTSIHLHGNLNARVTFNTQFNASARFDIDDGTLDFSKKFAPTFKAKVSFRLGPLTDPIMILTPCQNDAELNWDHAKDEHVYPVKFQLYVNKPIVFKGILMKIENHKVDDFSGASNPTSLQFEIPKGYGEYDPDHDDCNEVATNIHNQDRGDNDIKDKQEVARADGNVAGISACTMHVWLRDALYSSNPATDASFPISFQINFEYRISPATNRPVIVLKPIVDLTGLKPSYIRHGCDDIVTGTLIGFFVDIDEMINKKIQTQIDNIGNKISQGITLNF